ncbi:outer membrane protein transport protein, partial [bacterium]|nr:outer membrane protein transport protein [bacterium]
MAHYRLIFTILILLMFYFGFVFGAGMHLPGIGAKGIGMGGAFRGVADDATAIYWNPAGIAQLDRSQILLKGQLLYNNFTYSPSEIMLQNAHVLREGEQPLLNRSFILGHLFGVLSFPEFPSLKAGLGVYAPLGVGSRWDVMKDHDLDYITEINLRDILPFLPDSNIEITVNELLPEQDFVGFIGAYTISPAISYQITPRMALGFSPLFTYSILEVKMPVMDSVRMEADTGLVFGESRMKGTSYGVHLG